MFHRKKAIGILGVDSVIYFLRFLVVFTVLSGCDGQSQKANFSAPRKMNSANIAAWTSFLTCWSNEARRANGGQGTAQIFKWPDDEELSIDRVNNLENRLNVELPQSYKDFLYVTKGDFQFLHFFSDEKISAFHEVNKVDKYSKISKANWKMWKSVEDGYTVPDKDYFVYGEEQNPPYFRIGYLDAAIEVGHFYWGTEEFILLNNAIKTSNNESEAWWLSSKNPGAIRFKTFADLMIAFYFNDTREILHASESQIKDSCAKDLYRRY